MDKITYGNLPSFFILGYYYPIETIYINLTLNPNHIAFLNHIVPSDYYDALKSKLKNALENYECPLLHKKMNKEDLEQLKIYLKRLTNIPKERKKIPKNIMINYGLKKL